ncbi:MAG TPA: hypothetical protein VJY62_02470 [Bacteroidia bacterium]|nr:hypothetical protein [Bacteroidia bacterium]
MFQITIHGWFAAIVVFLSAGFFLLQIVEWIIRFRRKDSPADIIRLKRPPDDVIKKLAVEYCIGQKRLCYEHDWELVKFGMNYTITQIKMQFQKAPSPSPNNLPGYVNPPPPPPKKEEVLPPPAATKN